MIMYTSGQLAKKAKVSIRTIQYYDRRGLLHARRTTNGLRNYSNQDLRQLQKILIYKKLGFTLNDIQKIINDNDNSTLKSLIAQRQNTISYQIKDLTTQLKSLNYLEKHLIKFDDFPGNFNQDILSKVRQVKKLRTLRISLILVGILIDLLILVSIFYFFLRLSNSLLFIIGIVICLILSWGITMFYYQHTQYLCSQCHHEFTVPFKEWFFAKHTPSTRYLFCSNCHKKSYCIEEYR